MKVMRHTHETYATDEVEQRDKDEETHPKNVPHPSLSHLPSFTRVETSQCLAPLSVSRLSLSPCECRSSCSARALRRESASLSRRPSWPHCDSESRDEVLALHLSHILP